jgi:hypothetical protein
MAARRYPSLATRRKLGWVMLVARSLPSPRTPWQVWQRSDHTRTAASRSGSRGSVVERERPSPREAAEVRHERVDGGRVEGAAVLLAPGRHGGAGAPVGDRVAEEVVGGDGEEIAVAEGVGVIGGVSLGAVAVAQGAVPEVVRTTLSHLG